MASSILNITCNSEIECSNTGTISDIENIYPGFQSTRKITVTNNRDTQCELVLQTQFDNLESLIQKYTKISLSESILTPNQRKDINVRIYVSTTADDSFANLSEKINFNFKINCVPSSTSSGTIAGVSTTNKSFNYWWPFISFVLLIFVMYLRLAKKRE